MTLLNTPLGKDIVEQLLPQKFPFVMLDTMYAFTERSLVSGFKVQKDNIFLDGGYFSEAGLIEHMAQSVALHTGYQCFLKKAQPPVGYIGAIKNIEINQLPALYDEIRTTVSVLHEFGGVTLVNICTRLNGTEIATGQMKTALAK